MFFFVDEDTPGLQGNFADPLSNLVTLFQYNLDVASIPIIFITAAMGLTTSLVLRQYSVVAKEYANFVEMCLVTIGAYLWLFTEIKLSLLISIIIVCISLYLYNTAPHHSSASSTSSSSSLSSISVSTDKGAETTTYVLSKLSPDAPDSEIELELVKGAIQDDQRLHKRDIFLA